MSFSFSSLLRMIVLLALASTVLAIGVARLDPARPDWRYPRSVRISNVSEHFLDVTDRAPRWLDAESGRVVCHPLADADVLEAASCSPWVDAQGQAQVVGRWSSRTTPGPLAMTSDFGLARYSYPGGEVLDHVSTPTIPISPPCWFPGTRARVAFVSGDGLLYHFAFEGERSAQARPGSPRNHLDEPAPIRWRCRPPGSGEVFFGDAIWPEDPRMHGALVVNLSQQDHRGSGPKAYSSTRLWWLKLNNAGTEIVEAGPLFAPGRPGEPAVDVDQRAPSVATGADGRLMLAYLEQRRGQKGWDLRVAPLAIDEREKSPRAEGSTVRTLARGCLAARPAFSGDGRWLNAIVGGSASDGRVARVRTGGP